MTDAPEPSPQVLHIVTQDVMRRLDEAAPQIAQVQNAELWTEPLPKAVALMLNQLLGRERHNLLDQCEHIDWMHPLPVFWIASKEPGRLRCDSCSMADRNNMYRLDPRMPNRSTPTCDLCRLEHDDMVRGIAVAGLIIACLKLCRSCLVGGAS